MNRRGLDRFFFPGMAALMLGAVFAGFARSYYLAGVFRAPLPNLLIHVHGAVFSAWILLLIAQTSLAAARRVDLHRRLGMFGFALACLMLILGLLAGADELRREDAPGDKGVRAKATFVLPVSDMLAFSTLAYCGFRRRLDPPEHKRFMILATIAILDAAIIRWPLPETWWGLQAAQMTCYVFLIVLAGYDLWSTRKVHRVTLWAGLLLILLQQARTPIARTAAWQGFAAAVGQRAPLVPWLTGL